MPEEKHLTDNWRGSKTRNLADRLIDKRRLTCLSEVAVPLTPGLALASTSASTSAHADNTPPLSPLLPPSSSPWPMLQLQSWANTSTTSIAGCHSPSRGRLFGRAATRNQNRQSRPDNRPVATGRPSRRWRIRLDRRCFPRVTSNGQTPHFWKRTTSTTLATMRATTLAPSPAGAMRLDQGAAFRCQISASRVCSPGRGSASRTAGARMLVRQSRLWGR